MFARTESGAAVLTLSRSGGGKKTSANRYLARQYSKVSVE
jgi:hypothetical protein